MKAQSLFTLFIFCLLCMSTASLVIRYIYSHGAVVHVMSTLLRHSWPVRRMCCDSTTPTVQSRGSQNNSSARLPGDPRESCAGGILV